MQSAAEWNDCPSTDSTHQSWKTSEGFAAATLHPPALENPWMRSFLKIPRQDRTIFARPELAITPDLARANAEFLNETSLAIQGRSLREFRQQARQEILELAGAYTGRLLGKPVSWDASADLLFCGGHQPALFHPGVWIKNFAIHALSRRANGVALNLVIDNDTINHRQLRIPTGDQQHPATSLLAFDDPVSRVPWEEAAIENAGLFESFGPRVTEAMQPWNITPLLSEIWPVAIAQSQGSSSLRDALTAARVHLEHQWGLSNLEVPLSEVCETEAFCWFAAAILTRLPKFWETYNQVLAEFRQVNHIRSQTHPVPALMEKEGWYEAPFWVWRAGGQQRLRVLAKACSQEVRLSDGREIFARLPISATGDVTAACEILKNLPLQGIRFRTRALTTTLFARLCLADLFVHGIGGAKYDEMTDRLITRFFGLPAPGFLTVSCTVHLPLGKPFPVGIDEEQALTHQLRDLQFNPERHLSQGADPALDNLIAEKKTLIAQLSAERSFGVPKSARRKFSRENHARHLRLKEITQQLAAAASEPKRLLEQELATVRQHVQANAVLEDREFSFGLYPEEKLRPFLLNLP